MNKSLEELVTEYKEVNDKYNKYKKERKPLNNLIKQKMSDLSLRDFEFEGITVKYSVRERSSIEEEKLLRILKDNNLEEFIVVTEKPDVDKLEEAILANEVEASILAECVETKEIEYLNVKDS